MKIGKHVARKRPPMFTYLMYILVATVVFTGVTFSGYISTSSGGDNARVAKFEISESVDGGVIPSDSFTISASLIPGQVDDTKIQVKNSSEVTVTYNITAANTAGNMPLEFYVYDDANNNGNCDSDEVLIPAPFAGELAPNKSANFMFRISWPAEKNDPVYAGLVDTISITLDAVQKD